MSCKAAGSACTRLCRTWRGLGVRRLLTTVAGQYEDLAMSVKFSLSPVSLRYRARRSTRHRAPQERGSARAAFRSWAWRRALARPRSGAGHFDRGRRRGGGALLRGGRQKLGPGFRLQAAIEQDRAQDEKHRRRRRRAGASRAAAAHRPGPAAMPRLDALRLDASAPDGCRLAHVPACPLRCPSRRGLRRAARRRNEILFHLRFGARGFPEQGSALRAACRGRRTCPGQDRWPFRRIRRAWRVRIEPAPQEAAPQRARVDVFPAEGSSISVSTLFAGSIVAPRSSCSAVRVGECHVRPECRRPRSAPLGLLHELLQRVMHRLDDAGEPIVGGARACVHRLRSRCMASRRSAVAASSFASLETRRAASVAALAATSPSWPACPSTRSISR